MWQNIYDNPLFFDQYNSMRNDPRWMNANDLIEIPTILGMIPDLKGKSVLELGCGYGRNCQYFIDHGASFV